MLLTRPTTCIRSVAMPTHPFIYRGQCTIYAVLLEYDFTKEFIGICLDQWLTFKTQADKTISDWADERINITVHLWVSWKVKTTVWVGGMVSITVLVRLADRATVLVRAGDRANSII